MCYNFNNTNTRPLTKSQRKMYNSNLVGSVTGTISAGDDFLQRTDLNGNEYFDVPVLSTQKPSRRVFQATAFDEASSSIYIFGGQNAETGAVLSDAWQFNTDISEWTRLSDLPFPATGILAAAWYLTDTATAPAQPSTPFADGMRIMLVGGLDAQGAHIPNAYIFDGQDYQPIEIGPAKTEYKIFLPLTRKS